MRSEGIAYLLWFFFGVLGAHRFYCGRIGTGIIWALTGGLFGIGWLVDVFLVPSLVREANAETLSEQQALAAAAYQIPPPHPTVAAYAAPPARPMPTQHIADDGAAPGNRVVFCTRCGGAMQVPISAAGEAFACPSCRTVLEIPTFA